MPTYAWEPHVEGDWSGWALCDGLGTVLEWDNNDPPFTVTELKVALKDEGVADEHFDIAIRVLRDAGVEIKEG